MMKSVAVAVTTIDISAEQQPAPQAVLGPNVNIVVGPTFLKLGARPEDLKIQGTRCRTRLCSRIF